jgi:hypothetical protein
MQCGAAVLFTLSLEGPPLCSYNPSVRSREVHSFCYGLFSVSPQVEIPAQPCHSEAIRRGWLKDLN